MRSDPEPIATHLPKASKPDTSDKPLLRALTGQSVDHPPIWLMRQAGRYLPEYKAIRKRVGGILELCYTPELATEVTLQPVERFGVDAAILFSDILVVPHGLGQDVAFHEGEGPVLTAIRDEADLTVLSTARLKDHLAPVYEAVRQIRAQLPTSVALIGFAGAPWTVATYMVEGGTSRDFATVKHWAFSAPAAFGRLIDLLIDATAAHLIAQVDAGAEVVQLFDTWASALPPPALARWSIAPTREIVRRLRAQHPTVPIIGFPRGIGVSYPSYIEETGVDAVGLDAGVPLAWAAETLQTRVAVQGNLDPILLLSGGAAMRTATQEILSALGGGRFVFNLGHGVVPSTPPEHVGELVDLVHAFHR